MADDFLSVRQHIGRYKAPTLTNTQTGAKPMPKEEELPTLEQMFPSRPGDTVAHRSRKRSNPYVFRLSIELGNAAMQTGGDIRAALQDRDFLNSLYTIDPNDKRVGANEGRIRDANGGTVGTWRLSGGR